MSCLDVSSKWRLRGLVHLGAKISFRLLRASCSKLLFRLLSLLFSHYCGRWGWLVLGGVRRFAGAAVAGNSSQTRVYDSPLWDLAAFPSRLFPASS